jgi:hypothetical protein
MVRLIDKTNSPTTDHMQKTMRIFLIKGSNKMQNSKPSPNKGNKIEKIFRAYSAFPHSTFTTSSSYSCWFNISSEFSNPIKKESKIRGNLNQRQINTAKRKLMVEMEIVLQIKPPNRAHRHLLAKKTLWKKLIGIFKNRTQSQITIAELSFTKT